MPTNHTNRVVLILVLMWVSLSAIYPRAPLSLYWIFSPRGEINLHPNLKPGIDMVGGTSLIYEIQQPDKSKPDPKLSENVATALKKRVDPQGVRNLIWRPQGPNRLEIQMPASRQSASGEKLRKEYNDARAALEATNVRVAAVIGDIETLSGPERDAKIKAYAGDSASRLSTLNQMAALADRIKSARQNHNVAAAAAARVEYEPLQEKLSDSNLPIGQLEAVLQLEGDERPAKLKALRDRFADFPSRLAAIDRFVSAFDSFEKVRGSLDDVSDLKRKLQGSGVLSFNIVVERDAPEYEPMAKRLQEIGPRSQPGDVAKWFQVDRPDQFRGLTETYSGKSYMLAYIDPERSMMNGAGLPNWGLESAKKENENGRLVIAFEFNAMGSKLFGDLTGRFRPSAGREYKLAIVLDDKVYSAPNIQTQIFKRGQITGGSEGFSEADASYLASTLSAGALPAQLTSEPISEITVGPQLGSDNLKAGFISCGAGLVIVAIFLISYYYLAGVVAFVAVLVNLLLIIGGMAIINATFTLPGVAGIVLSVAMAVDANVLIFERLREEQARGLSLRMALRNSYDRAFSAIFDGQLTTAISSVFLFWFGSEEVRGFGLTLLIGIVTSLFTALFVTKTIFAILVDRFGLSDLGSLPRTFPRWNEMLTPRVDWVSKSWIFTAFSVLFIGIGIALFAIKLHKNEALDVEFSGGTAVRIVLKDKLDREGVQNIVDKIADESPDKLASPRVVSVGTDQLQYEISTPTTNTRAVQAVLIEKLGDKLVVNQPSRFDMVDADFDTAFNQAVFPIEGVQTRIEGVPPYLAAGHVDGVAIVLNHITPPLDLQTMRDRILQRADQEERDTRPERIEVELFDNNTRAVVLMSDSRYAYNPADANTLAQWRSNLAGPAWQIVKDAVHNPPQLRSVTSFNAQVAGEAKWNTAVALTLSFLGIMAYVWFRFGDMRFGLATIVACVHDAAFVIAAVGFSHYLGQIDLIDRGLLIRPFRVDLTLIAAVLTVVGYSMNDTVVVFDRIRENRGKFGALSRQVVNDSINQTFSRTILTGGTSIGILLVMYIIGGEGIHGFTFVMLLGIIAGTYSSVAIAAPLLLVGVPKSESVAITKSSRTQPAAG
jgi:SecD/SecF fusion protein